ncbi:hypothetical protein CRG98_006145 [Punica granatum]|uniref:Uncharacterized protein n=1 Tax=Punica granatum TaxID=22663 RepID=A0A2I0KYA0_PUNGR|nr:hypothetical protein CRG98_006145 [Punica granatum]
MNYSSKPDWRMAWSSYKMHGFSATGTVLRKDGGSRLKGFTTGWSRDFELWAAVYASERESGELKDLGGAEKESWGVELREYADRSRAGGERGDNERAGVFESSS